MSTIGKIASVVSALILMVSGIMFLMLSMGTSDNQELTTILVSQKTNSKLIADMTRDVSDLIVNYNEYQSAKKSQIEGEKEIIKKSVTNLNEEMSTIEDDEGIVVSNVNFLEKQIELINTAAETAIWKYEERKAKEDAIKKAEENNKTEDKKPDDVVEKPDVKPNDKPEDNTEEKPVEEGADSVVLNRPKKLPPTYPWPVSEIQRSSMMSGIVYIKSILFNYLKTKVDEKGEFNSFNREVPEYLHIGQNALAYSIFAQETNSGSLSNILNNINEIRLNSETRKILTSEIAYTLIGIIYAKMQAKSKLSQNSPWEPLNYTESKGFNETEKKIIEWTIKTLISRQTKSGGWSNYHISSEVIYDYDVVTTSISMYALTHAYQAGFKEHIKEEMLVEGVKYLLKMQNKQEVKAKSPVLDQNEIPFDNVNIRGWGFNSSAKPSVRTTAMTVAAINKTMKVMHEMSQKNDDIVKKCKVAVVDGFAFIEKYWMFSEDFQTNWAIVQACASAGISRIGRHDVYSELMTYFADRTQFNRINNFSFQSITFAYWCMNWCRQEQGFFKPMKISGYEKEEK